MAVGIFFLKLIPKFIFGDQILFDASFHLVTSFFFLYILWFFVDQNKNWRIPFFFVSLLFLSIVSFQRIADNAHNDIGLFLGLAVSIFSIGIAEKKYLKGKLKF